MKEIKRAKLKEMPYDKVFEVDDHYRKENCHCTGYEVQDENGILWNEYRDSKGNLYYGR